MQTRRARHRRESPTVVEQNRRPAPLRGGNDEIGISVSVHVGPGHAGPEPGQFVRQQRLAREVRERLFSVPVVERAGNVLKDSFHERGPRDVRHPLSA